MNPSLARSLWVALFTIAALAGAVHPASAKGEPLLVDAEWLAPRLNDRHLVVLHVGGRAGYDKAHIAGARQITEEDVSRPHDMANMKPGELMLELPQPDVLRARLMTLGISDDSVIVVYAGPDAVLQSATRIVFTLDYLGLGGQTSLLDGGWAAWQAAGKAATDAAPHVTPGTLRVRPVNAIVADAAMVQSMSNRADVKVVDARAPVFYTGAEPTFNGKRGHIPHAINIPFSAISDNAGRINRPDLKRLFFAAGVKTGDTVVAYCHVGQQATAVVFAARLLGYRVLLYDGAFQDWTTNNRGGLEQ